MEIVSLCYAPSALRIVGTSCKLLVVDRIIIDIAPFEDSPVLADGIDLTNRQSDLIVAFGNRHFPDLEKTMLLERLPDAQREWWERIHPLDLCSIFGQ